MKIAVIASNGRVGKLVVKEALERGFEVTGIGNEKNESLVKHYIEKNALDLTKNDLEGFDVVVDAVGGWTPDTIHNITDVMKHLADILSNTETRLLVVGGAGSLFVDKAHTITVDMGADFPDSWKPLSAAHGEGLAYLRGSKYLNWTYLSPACNFVAEGEETRTYTLGEEELILNSQGESTISYADYAIALVDEIENAKHIKERISVVSK